MARLLKGAPVAARLTEEVASRSAALSARGVVPTLCLIRVGERADDLSYERGLLKRAASAGVDVRKVVLDPACSQGELMAAIASANADSAVHGILMFRPLPASLDEAAACEAIAPEKDVDCLTQASLAGVFTGSGEGYAPCTADAVMHLLADAAVSLEGAHVTVVGRSLVIGRPVAMMLQAANATVTMCHSKTRDLAQCCREADVLVVACGRARMVGADCVRAGQVVVDVGINWDESAGRLVGDVDFDAVEPVVDTVTPVPGGVGSLTTAVLMKHVVQAAERAAARTEGE